MLDGIRPKLPEEQPGRHALWKKPKRKFRFGVAVVLFILLVAGIIIGSRLVIYAQRVLDKGGGIISFRDFFMSSDKQLQGEEDGLVRILLMGIGGENHDGGTLTDTMILATLKVEDGKVQKVGLVSIPRDFVVDIPGYDFRKINSAYAYGELEGEGQGAQWAINTVERLIGKNIPYYAVIDFKGFAQIIDDLGGVDVTVETSFTDSLYPDEKEGFLAPITFEAGPQHMDGTRALQFVRSRHGNNGEGSDFARSRRQQLILEAVQNEVRGINVISNINLVNQILNDLSNHLRLNLEPFELKRAYDISKDITQDQIVTFSIDVESGIVCNQIDEETGAYLLVPCGGLTDYSGIRNVIDNQFSIGTARAEAASIEVQNASGQPGLGRQAAALLTLPGLETSVSNFSGQTVFKQNVIYDNTKGAKPATLDYLKTQLGAFVSQSPFPFSTEAKSPDFVIIIATEVNN